MNPSRFLSAEWRYLAMINYEIDPSILLPYLSRGIELDQWQGKTFVSIVGFLFLRTRVCGLAIPFHRDFEEINLRFYVRRRADDGWRRGVVFIKEIVPRQAIATIARVFYNENYMARPTLHVIDLDGGTIAPSGSVKYAWCEGDRWYFLRVRTIGGPQPLQAGSEEEFITEHYWGYAKQRDGGSIEYQVEHPPWRIWQVGDAEFNCDVERVYGRRLSEWLSATPTSAFVAVGSPVVVRKGVRI